MIIVAIQGWYYFYKYESISEYAYFRHSEV